MLTPTTSPAPVRMHSFFVVALSLVLLALPGCAHKSNFADLPQLSRDAAPIAAPAPVLGQYQLQIGDVLDIKFPLNPELNETVTVRPDGLISTGIAEDVPAYNLTASELNEELRQAYKNELVDPKVSVVVRSFAPTRIYVSGEVAAPGEFVVVGPALTLTQAIARAGGVLNSADDKHVLILRRGAGEKSEGFLANYHAATQGGDPTQDARLAAYDVVFVPKSGAAMAYKDFQQYFQQYVTPTVGVSASHSF